MGARKDRWFTIVTYCSEDVVKGVIFRYNEYIKAYAYIHHDMDGNDNHFHVILRTYNTHTYGNIRNWFIHVQDDYNDHSNTFVQSIKDKQGIVEYLTHEHEPAEKYKYDKANIVDGGLNEFISAADTSDTSFDIIMDILDGVPTESLCRIYGRDFIYHMRYYYDAAQRINTENLRKKERV